MRASFSPVTIRLAVPSLLLCLALAACDGQLLIRGAAPVPSLPDAGSPDAASPSVGDAARPPPSDAAVGARPDAVVPPPPDAWTAPPPGCDDPIELEVIRLANQARATAGLGALECDPTMVAVARGHSSDMCAQDYFDHTSLDGRSPFDRMREGGVRFSSAGENIAWGQRSAAEVHTSWMNSSGHRRNILGSGYGRIGVGLEECGGSMYWTQIFAD